MESGIGYDQEDIDKTLSDGSIDADFADKFVGDEVVRRIATALTNDSTKKRVLLDRNCIGADGAAALGEMLKANNSITSLSLEWNGIGSFEQGIQWLSEGLEANGTLISLALCNNNISTEGAEFLSRALRTNSTLTELDLRWNDVGNDGARSILDALATNRSLTSVKLSGNKIDEFLLENIDAALSDRQSGALEQTVLRDDLHISREKTEQLEARLRRQAIEEEARKRLDLEKDEKWRENVEAVKQEAARNRLDFERQMGSSAKQMAQLEEQLIYERSRATEARERLAREGERREATQGDLDKTKQTLLETKRDLSRQVERLQDALDSANEDRRITQSELERVRDVLEREVANLKEELRSTNSEVEATKRAAARSASEAEQAIALLETARTEVTITAERADEAVAATARATRDGVKALEETRRMYEERLDGCKLDNDARVKAIEDRARQSDHERQRTEMARQQANKELVRLQVSIEERLSQNENRALTDAKRQFDLQLAELLERIDTLQKSRESKEAQAREHFACLDALRSRSATELRDFGRELAAAGKELEVSREATRNHESKASKLQAEVGLLHRTIGSLEKRLEEAEKDKRQAAELYSTNETKAGLQHSLELKDSEKRLAEARSAYSGAEERAKDLEEQMTTVRQSHLRCLHALESTMGQAFMNAITSARLRGDDA